MITQNQSEQEISLQKELKATINAMKKIQKESASSGQPMSGSELERLTQLGLRYSEIIGCLKRS